MKEDIVVIGPSKLAAEIGGQTKVFAKVIS